MGESLMRNGAQVSPERYVVWTESSRKRKIKYQQGTKVQVAYYLCNNSLFGHPHFIEVPFSSTDGLYLRDVINHLTVLRGNQMAATYSWSCKRSYRNGFVWQDLAEDDLILPAPGKNYILKGSLLLNLISADILHTNNNNGVLHNLWPQQEEQSLYSSKVEASSCLSPIITQGATWPLSFMPFHHSSSSMTSSSSSRECCDFMPTETLVFSTQAEDTTGRKEAPEPSTQTTTLSGNDELSQNNFNQKDVLSIDDGIEKETSQTPVPWNAGMDTLVSLIRADVNELDRFSGTEGKGFCHQLKEKIKRTKAFLQLTCRSLLDKISRS